MGEVTGDQQMKEFIYLTEELLSHYARATRPDLYEAVVEESTEEPGEHPMLSECRDIVFKLRTFMEDSAGEYALGVESGMQRAADMIEHMIKRYEKGDGLEQY